MSDHTCILHLAGDRLCYKGCGCRCEDCTEMHHWSYRGPRPAAPELYLQDLSDGNCAGFPQFTELPDAAQGASDRRVIRRDGKRDQAKERKRMQGRRGRPGNIRHQGGRK